MISQTKDVISRLLASGFSRSDFRVRTRRNRRGEYEARPDITILRRLTGIDICRLVGSGFDVSIIVAGQYVSFLVEAREPGEAARVRVERI